MKKILIPSLVALLGVSPLLHAQAYKCKQPDGSTSFQDHPCAAGSSGSTVDLMPAQGYSSDDVSRSLGTASSPHGGHSRRAPGQDGADGSNAQIDAENARVEAHNRQVSCNEAIRTLGVLKEQRPVYHYDKNGNKIYVEDDARPAALAAAQQRVATECK